MYLLDPNTLPCCPCYFQRNLFPSHSSSYSFQSFRVGEGGLGVRADPEPTKATKKCATSAVHKSDVKVYMDFIKDPLSVSSSPFHQSRSVDPVSFGRIHQKVGNGTGRSSDTAITSLHVFLLIHCHSKNTVVPNCWRHLNNRRITVKMTPTLESLVINSMTLP